MRAVRILLWIVAAVFALALSLIAGLVVIGEFWPEVLTGSPPPIAAGLDFKSEDGGPASKAWDARIRARFPAGSREEKLRQVLLEQGFRFEPQIAPGLVYAWGGFGCSNILIVTWSADGAHHVVKASGDYQVRCI